MIQFLLGGSGLDPWGFATLCGISFLGSFVTASMGIGGGGLVLATMALFLPPPVLIPLHGVVQLGSNIGRAALMARDVFLEIVPLFLFGTLLGALVGGQLVVTLPVTLLQTVLGMFILYSAWAPGFKAKRPTKRNFFLVGAVGTFLTMFIGATGPLITPFIAAACDKRQQVVATRRQRSFSKWTQASARPMATRREQPTTAASDAPATIPCSGSTSSAMWNGVLSVPATSTAPTTGKVC